MIKYIVSFIWNQNLQFPQCSIQFFVNIELLVSNSDYNGSIFRTHSNYIIYTPHMLKIVYTSWNLLYFDYINSDMYIVIINMDDYWLIFDIN